MYSEDGWTMKVIAFENYPFLVKRFSFTKSKGDEVCANRILKVHWKLAHLPIEWLQIFQKAWLGCKLLK